MIDGYWDDLEFGKVQKFEKMAVIPLISPNEGGAVYLTLREALEMNMLTITEVDESGRVPELKAINKSELPILILDGEELVGAKQNRVLNTAVLLKGDSETIIPVSCTEEGRWSYRSKEFHDLGYATSYSLRNIKRFAVSDSLRRNDSYHSDQSSIWNKINEDIRGENCESPTKAYRDIYESRENDINEYLETLELLEGQTGIIVFINGEIKGIDTVSSHVSYRALHEKLLKSYVMDAVLSKEKRDFSKFNLKKKAISFIKDIKDSFESKYKSIGHGWDHRFESDSVLGSALVCQNEVIHASFFKKEKKMNDDRFIAGYRMRRAFRSEN